MLKRNKSLDTIRGIAIFFVIVAHYFSNAYKYANNIKILGDYDINLGIIGRGGVMLFFLLSGFLIFHSLQNNNSIIRFYKKRFLRIYPPYLFSILFYLAVVYLVFDFMLKYNLHVYFINLLMLQDIFSAPIINGVYWTLLIEIKFYFIIAIIYLMNRKYKQIIDIFFILMLFINLFIFFKRGYGSWLLTWMPLFWMGIYLYNYLNNFMNSNKFIIVFFVLMVYFYLIDEFNLSIFLLLDVIIFMIIYKKNLSGRIFEFYGKISYSFYLLHTTISYPIFYYITSNYTQYYLWLKILIAFVLSTIISYFSFKYIENFYFREREKI